MMISRDEASPFSSCQTLVDVLRWRAKHEPGRPAYLYLKNGLTAERPLTYADLDRQVRMVAAWLQGHAHPGDRALLLYGGGLEVVIAFWACLYAGITAVPAPPPDAAKTKHSLPRLKSIVRDAQVTVVLASHDVLEALTPYRGDLGLGPDVLWCDTSAIELDSAAAQTEHSPSPESLAYLQYTSGSTSDPKGVMVTHASLLHHSAILSQAVQGTQESRSLTWLPYFHDYGLIHGIIVPVFLGTPSYLMSPLAFLKSPMKWLMAIATYRITHSGGPNFAYEHCLKAASPGRQANLDLSSWKVATCGAEPVRASTISAFVAAWKDCGFSPDAFTPAYGMAEYTLLVSAKAAHTRQTILEIDGQALALGRVVPAEAPDASVRPLVACGAPIGDTVVAIVDPQSMTRCAQDRVGEIWLAGKSAAQGYWNRPAETAEAFHAYLADTGEGPFLRTGDLGFLRDGEVYITGRRKDLIIIRGRNYYPQDVELTAEQAHPALRPRGGAAFSIDTEAGEQAVLVHEVERATPQDQLESIVSSVRQQVAEQHELHLSGIVLIKAGSLSRTSSGKVQRGICKDLFLHDGLQIVVKSVSDAAGEPEDRELHQESHTRLSDSQAVEEYIRQVLAEQLKLPLSAIAGTTSLANLGLDSLMTSMVKNRLERRLGISPSFAQLLSESTIRELAGEIWRNQTSEAASSELLESDQSLSGNGHRPDVAAKRGGAKQPLSFGQQRICFLEDMHPGSGVNHISIPMRLQGPLDKQAFNASVERIVRCQAVFRTAFAVVGGEAYQTIASAETTLVRYGSVRDLPASAQDEEIKRWLREEALVPFDLGKPPLLRVLILEHSENDYVGVVTVHRLIADGWTTRLFCKQLTAFYVSEKQVATDVTLSSFPDYLEFAEWQRDRLGANKYETQLSYWKRQLHQLPQPLDLPTDRPRPRGRQFQGGARYRVLPDEVVKALETMCRRQGATKFMVLYAAFTAWLQRCSRMTDIVVGSVVANRRLAQWENVCGYFANTVALRMNLSDTRTVDDLVVQARRIVAEAFDNQEIPFELVLEALDGARPSTSSYVFNVMMVWEDDPLVDLRLSDVTVSRLPIDEVAVEVDLTLLVVSGLQGIELVMLYDKALFDGPTVDRMLGQLTTLLAAMLANASAQISDLPLLGVEEEKQVVHEWNQTASAIPFASPISNIVDGLMGQYPDNTAVISGEVTLSYAALQAQVNGLASRICEVTKGRAVRVALCAEHTYLGLVGILGILKAGAAYVPLDPHAPEPRQRQILEDADVALLVTQRHLRSHVVFDGSRVLELESVKPEDTQPTAFQKFPTVDLSDLAYVIYTSGSTGRPKGVEVTHRALLYSLAARLQYYTEPVRGCLLTFPWAFDGSVTGMFWTLLHAGTLVIPSEDSHRDPHELRRLISRHQISHVIWVPSLYDVILRDMPATALRSLRIVVTAGENLPTELVRRHHELLPDVALYNEYGPTETTVWAAVYRTNGTEDGARIPIGKPIANTRIYLLDSSLRPVPIGVVGEIYIGGASLARGYLGQPALTNAQFIPNPFSPPSRLYKTGDLGVRRQDGNVEFVGRVDQQIKLRGYRIELGEVEATLRDLPGIRDGIAIVKADWPTGPALIAFVTSDGKPPASSAYLKTLMKRSVPAYMVPTAIVVMETFPLLASGKVDRQALARQELGEGLNESVSLQPRDPIEQSLIEIWSDVLRQGTIDIHASFFSLGGHSLLATQVVSRIRDTFRVELPLRVLFESPTIAGVAEQIRLERRRAVSRPSMPPIVPASRTMPLPVSYSQQRMWLVQQLSPQSTAYNLLFVSRHKGALRVSVLRQVVEMLSRRHEAFRTTFAMTPNGLVQRITPWQSPHMAEIDLRRLPQEDREPEARRLAEEEGARPFDLERGPLARISLIKIDSEDHLLVLNLHHIVGDQWSFGILGHDFAKYYNALCQHQALPETPLPIQYADYAVWQRRVLTEEALKAQEQYWTERLTALPILHLPTDYSRPTLQTFKGAYCSVDIPDAVIEQLKQFSAQRQATSFMTMLACFQLLLSRYSGQVDLAVGSPIANRTQMSMEHLIGTFVNTLVLRADLSGNPSFDELLERVKDSTLGAFLHQDYPFDKLVESLQVERDASMAPLVQVLFNMVNAPIGDIHLWGLKWEPFEVEPGSAQFDLSLTVELAVAKKAYLTFNTDLFERDTAERILSHFLILIQSALANPSARVSELPMLSSSERVQLIQEWNRTASDYPWTQCLPELFAAQANESPDATAVSMERDSLSYRALNNRVNQLARVLCNMGVGASVAVGICLERSPEMVVALLAVLKSGGCYVPLDSDYPRDRLRFMVDDSAAKVIVTTSGLSNRFTGQACRILCLDRDHAQISRQDEHDLPPRATPQDLAYILYTSGSTGQPKGVEIRHRSLVNFLWSMKREPGCSFRDVVLSVTTLSFDIAGLELYLPLVAGGRVEIVSRAVAMDGKKLRDCMERVRPTIMQATPATWRLLLEAGWAGSSILTALCGGEALSLDLASKICERTKALWNMYGPTETTIWSTLDRVDANDAAITIGRPIANTEIYILDSHLGPVPMGVAGEIFIGGDGLAKGYRNRLDLTAERFIRHPFSMDPHALLYRTGDLARYRKDGKIVHLGRSDQQVKVRGFRIELGEIESVLSRHPELQQVVVTAREDQYGMKQLVAYLVPHDGHIPTAEQLRAFLRSSLPEYMVPSFFQFLKALPLTANNKVDVRALPPPSFPGPTRETSHAGPRDGLELQLMTLWQQVLGIQEIGIYDNFFDLGGHSLKAAQLFYQLELVFGRPLPLATLFQAPTIAQLAEVLARENWTPPWQSLVAIQPSGSATPLFMVPGVGGNVLVFARLAKLLGTDQPIYGLQARGLDGKESPFISVAEMATHYIQAIRQVHPSGPYRIVGVCTGGLIAFEMARQLSAHKEHATIVMLDTWHPDSFVQLKRRVVQHVFMVSVILGKIWTDLRLVSASPMKEWWVTTKRKSRVLLSLFSQSVTDHIRDQDFQVQRLTKATLLAVARYGVEPIKARIINVVASRHQVKDGSPDTRHSWQELGGDDSCLLYIPAENSGRMFVSPYVEELANHLKQLCTDPAEDPAGQTGENSHRS